MSIPGPLVIRQTHSEDAKDYRVGTVASEILATEMGIVINSADYTEKTQTCNGVLRQCLAQLLTVLKERRGSVFLNVSAELPGGDNRVINGADTTVAVGSVAVIVGNLFGQDAVYNVGGAALLNQQSHNIDATFKVLLNILNELEETTPDAPAAPAPALTIPTAAGTPGTPAIVRVTSSPYLPTGNVAISSTVDSVGVQSFSVDLTRQYSARELAAAITDFAKGWTDVTTYLIPSSNPNIQDVAFEPHLGATTINLDTAVYTPPA